MHVVEMDSMYTQLLDGSTVRLLNIIDDVNREALTIEMDFPCRPVGLLAF